MMQQQRIVKRRPVTPSRNFTFRVPQDLFDRLAASAHENRRTVAGELLWRLERLERQEQAEATPRAS